ncbi:DUF2301 domain-containing membrane protein [Aliagarivorans marinus]|uniref:DUF2301 domain-containing membrane protein n=1 Tax=Aliagarivorans marinus TaxID=561965 RepID=UPI0004263493|nr:DUF2301 domain-containing membrane protein [Aliagarivorans marinus]
MDDPHHRPQMDAFDSLSVLLYRGAWLSLAAILLYGCWPLLTGGHAVVPLWLLVASVAMLGAQLHIYLKPVRVVLQLAAWSALALALIYYRWHWPLAASLSLGACYVVAAGLSYKESFCFQFGPLRLLPIVFVADWLAAQFAVGRVVTLPVLALGVSYIAIAKCRQPLDFDIGDKSKYQY